MRPILRWDWHASKFTWTLLPIRLWCAILPDSWAPTMIRERTGTNGLGRQHVCPGVRGRGSQRALGCQSSRGWLARDREIVERKCDLEAGLGESGGARGTETRSPRCDRAA